MGKISWLRLRLEVDSALGHRPLGLVVYHIGAVEFYLDGELVYESGKVSASRAIEIGVLKTVASRTTSSQSDTRTPF